jgi:predicted metal-dependent hydrolase
MNIVNYGNRQISYEIVRTNRKKTVAIHVGLDAVTVRAPQRLDEGKINSIVQKKSHWIIERQERVKQENQIHPPKEFMHGESFPFLGRQYLLEVIHSENGFYSKCYLMNGRIQVEIGKNLQGKNAANAIKEALAYWYREHATRMINERLPYLSRQLGKAPAAVQIKDQKRRWGSCSHNGVVRFNWRIIMAPVPVLDYLIVHELCHLFHPDHSAAFWRKVQSIIPDFKKERDWLKNHAFIMNNFG